MITWFFRVRWVVIVFVWAHCSWHENVHVYLYRRTQVTHLSLVIFWSVIIPQRKGINGLQWPLWSQWPCERWAKAGSTLDAVYSKFYQCESLVPNYCILVCSSGSIRLIWVWTRGCQKSNRTIPWGHICPMMGRKWTFSLSSYTSWLLTFKALQHQPGGWNVF